MSVEVDLATVKHLSHSLFNTWINSEYNLYFLGHLLRVWQTNLSAVE
jgi:hypothetical protein